MKFLEGDRVELYNIPSMNGITGTICGRGPSAGVAHADDSNYPPGWGAYIIRVDDDYTNKIRSMGYNYSCVSITDACIRRIK
jgi:hypothetical protein